MDKIQDTLLELGRGMALVGRQPTVEELEVIVQQEMTQQAIVRPAV